MYKEETILQNYIINDLDFIKKNNRLIHNNNDVYLQFDNFDTLSYLIRLTLAKSNYDDHYLRFSTFLFHVKYPLEFDFEREHIFQSFLALHEGSNIINYSSLKLIIYLFRNHNIGKFRNLPGFIQFSILQKEARNLVI